MNTFEVNGKRYTGAELTYGNICLLEDYGVSITEIGGRNYHKNLSTPTAYFALSAGFDFDTAAEEIQADIVASGDMGRVIKGIMGAFTQAINESDFFQALRKRAATEIGQSETSEDTISENTEA